MFMERSLNDLSTPHHPTSSIFHCYPLPIHHPCFPSPLKILIIHKWTNAGNAEQIAKKERKANVTLRDFLRRFATMRCCHKNWCNVTCHCELFSAYPVARILSNQPVFAMVCYTGMIFNATSLQIVSLKIVQCDITLKT